MIARNLDELPADIIRYITTFLSIQEIARLRILNKRLSKIVNNTPLDGFGMWDTNSKGKKIIRLATFKELSDDINEQLTERRKKQNEHVNKEKSLINNLERAKRIRSCTDGPCPMIFTFLSAITAISLTLTGGISFVLINDLSTVPTLAVVTVTALGATVALGSSLHFSSNFFDSLDERAKKKVRAIANELADHHHSPNNNNEPIEPKKVIPLPK